MTASLLSQEVIQIKHSLIQKIIERVTPVQVAKWLVGRRSSRNIRIIAQCTAHDFGIDYHIRRSRNYQFLNHVLELSYVALR